MTQMRLTLLRVLMSDTAMMRFLLAVIASMWAVFLWIPVGQFHQTQLGTLFWHVSQRDGEMIWASFWSLLTVLKFWRIFDPVERPVAALIVNAYSTLMFASSVTASYQTRGLISADIADDIGAVLASLWVFLRTSIGNHSVVRE